MNNLRDILYFTSKNANFQSQLFQKWYVIRKKFYSTFPIYFFPFLLNCIANYGTSSTFKWKIEKNINYFVAHIVRIRVRCLKGKWSFVRVNKLRSCTFSHNATCLPSKRFLGLITVACQSGRPTRRIIWRINSRSETSQDATSIYFGLHPDTLSTYTFIFGASRGSGPDRWIAQPMLHHPLVSRVFHDSSFYDSIAHLHLRGILMEQIAPPPKRKNLNKIQIRTLTLKLKDRKRLYSNYYYPIILFKSTMIESFKMP